MKRKLIHCIRRASLVLAAAICLGLSVHASAQVFPFTNILRISVAPRISDGTSNTIATLGQAKDGSVALIVRSFDRSTGFQQGTAFSSANFPPGVTPKDVLVSTVFEPGSVLVLDSARRVHIFPLFIMGDGSVRLAGPPIVLGPLGPAGAGEGTVLGETLVTNTVSGTVSVLGIGTMNGEVFLATRNGGEVVSSDSLITGVPITDLGGIPQAGYFALGVVSGGKLFLINPDDDLALPGLQPRLMADLRDPRRIPFIDFGSPILTRDSVVFEPNDPKIVTANGMAEIATLEIPPNPTFGGTLTLKIFDPTCQPVKQVVFGSLTWLPTDGAGVLYNKGFTLEDGLVGRIWTIAGASMEFDPESLNLRSRGRFVAATIEVENQRAADINAATIALSVDGATGAVPMLLHPELVDADGDQNVDLKVKFDRPALIELLNQTTGGAAIVRATWRYTDGAPGEASAQIRVIR